MKRLGVLVITLVAARVETATAGSSCGSGGSSGSHSSSDSSTDDSSSFDSSSTDDSSGASPLVAQVDLCRDRVDVAGYARCKKFGAWGANLRFPSLIIELGTAVRQFASPLGERAGTISHGDESFSYRVIGPSSGARKLPLDTAVVATLRVGVALRYGFYVAADAEVGALTDGTARAEMTSSGVRGTPAIEQTSVAVLSGLGVAGVRARLGSLNLGVEAAGGFRTLTYNYDSKYHACEETMSITTGMTVLEARARAAVWVSPFVTLGATAGKSLIDDSWVGGIYVGAHSRAFGR